jgi:hypothetical protein|tara:strand:- start:1842 stop:2099 length:258 start_codon:yes stop_codon:yes gene_type:complete
MKFAPNFVDSLAIIQYIITGQIEEPITMLIIGEGVRNLFRYEIKREREEFSMEKKSWIESLKKSKNHLLEDLMEGFDSHGNLQLH